MNINPELLVFDETDKNNYYKIYYDNEIINFWINESLCPFGIENEYNKYILKIECTNTNIINYIEKIEDSIKQKYNLSDNQLKSCIRRKTNDKYNDIIVCRLRTNRFNKVNTVLKYKNETTNYLKTIYELEKNTYLNALVEISGVWDLREKFNKMGLVITIKNIIM